jgi:UDP-N-acetylmuramoylalanine--D-glutamate ligase
MTKHDPNNLRGRRVLLLGLGSRQGGVGVARYLVDAGADVRVTDLRAAEQLAGPLADLAGLPIAFTLGRHDEQDVRWAEVVVRNPAVPRESPWLALARAEGKRVEMEMSLFFRARPAPIAGVTGTKGKTTTTTLLWTMLRERWPAAVLAGNMGVSALEQLPSIDPDVPVALELSSFQLEGLDEHRLSPHVGVITNIAHDHLDRYATFEEYADVKGAIARHQRPEDWLVVPHADETIRRVAVEGAGRLVTFRSDMTPVGARCIAPALRPGASGREPGAMHRAPTDGPYALWITDSRFAGTWAGEAVDLGPVEALRLPGEHSRLNALAAAGAALALGVPPEAIRRAIASFQGVPHRLEHVATIADVDYVNDSAATAPAAALAALRAFSGREIVAITGGYDKHLPMAPLADELARRATHVVLLEGTVTPVIAALLHDRHVHAVHGPFDAMDLAVARAAELARPGSVVLLSPGCASFGLFRDEFDRGGQFRMAVQALIGDRDATELP